MDKYHILQPVGRGAFGHVYLAKNLQTNREVAIKTIPIDSISLDEKEATRSEVKVLSMLLHPNIIEYYDSFVNGSEINIVMEYAPQGNLYDFIQSRGSDNYLSEEEILHIFSQLVLGIQHIHHNSILHRDLKTHNVLLIQSSSSRRNVKIGDFGISKLMTSKSKATTVVGTPCYFSPEVCSHQPYNQKGDIWALGCILYEMMALHRAFEADILPTLIMKIMKGARSSPLPSCYSNRIKSIVDLLLELDPSRRPNIDQVYCHPDVLATIVRISSDYGSLPCKKV